MTLPLEDPVLYGLHVLRKGGTEIPYGQTNVTASKTHTDHYKLYIEYEQNTIIILENKQKQENPGGDSKVGGRN